MDSVFEVNPTENVLCVFPDGQCFFPRLKSDIDNHAKKTGTTYKVVYRKGFEPKEETEQPKEKEQPKNKKK